MKKNGFTLVETVVSITIFGLAMVMIIAVMTSGDKMVTKMSNEGVVSRDVGMIEDYITRAIQMAPKGVEVGLTTPSGGGVSSELTFIETVSGEIKKIIRQSVDGKGIEVMMTDSNGKQYFYELNSDRIDVKKLIFTQESVNKMVNVELSVVEADKVGSVAVNNSKRKVGKDIEMNVMFTAKKIVEQ